jgi:hypothetical protein
VRGHEPESNEASIGLLRVSVPFQKRGNQLFSSTHFFIGKSLEIMVGLYIFNSKPIKVFFDGSNGSFIFVVLFRQNSFFLINGWFR